jgi:hypothetical protein
MVGIDDKDFAWEHDRGFVQLRLQEGVKDRWYLGSRWLLKVLNYALAGLNL